MVIVGFSTYRSGVACRSGLIELLPGTEGESAARKGLLGESRSGNNLFPTPFLDLFLRCGVLGKGGGVTGLDTGFESLREGGGENNPVRFRFKRCGAGGELEGERVLSRERERPRSSCLVATLSNRVLVRAFLGMMGKIDALESAVQKASSAAFWLSSSAMASSLRVRLFLFPMTTASSLTSSTGPGTDRLLSLADGSRTGSSSSSSVSESVTRERARLRLRVAGGVGSAWVETTRPRCS